MNEDFEMFKAKFFLFLSIAFVVSFMSGCSTIAGYFKDDGAVLAAKLAVSEIIYQSDDACSTATGVMSATTEARFIVNDGLLSMASIDVKLAELIAKQDISPTSKIILKEIAKDILHQHIELVAAGEASEDDKITLNNLIDEIQLIASSYLGDC